MKKIATLLLAIASQLALYAQSLPEAKDMLMHERTATATEMLKDILNREPENVEAWYWLTEAYLTQEKLKEIKDTLKSAPASLANTPLMLAARGHLLLLDNNAQEAKQVFDQALKQTRQKDPEVLRAVAFAHFDADSGDTNFALELVNKAIKRDKGNPELYILLGDIYRKQANGSAAYRAYEKAISLDPRNAAAKYKLGKIFLSQNNPEMYVKYFKEAIAADSSYAPALYELYYYYYFRDVREAMNYLQRFINASDPNPEHEYMVTDLLYASRKYEEAIKHATALIDKQGGAATPRLYKLVAYSYQELKMPEKAAAYMQQYFKSENDSNFLAKDFELMGAVYASMEEKSDSAEWYYKKAIGKTENDTLKWDFYKKLADLYTQNKNYSKQAEWLGNYYSSYPSASNRDLFDWGVASYMAKNYKKADSVFALYEEKYPDQRFGYYWRARSNAALDTNMEKGLAIPHYLKVIEFAEKDTTDEVNRKRLIESYAYLAAYKANTVKDYAAAIEYFNKLLMIQPDNADARRYIQILQKNVEGNKSSNAGSS
jgi:tetratricopeptide (TPR) repeat protein